MKYVLVGVATVICLMGNLRAENGSSGSLKFRAAENGEFTFDTGLLRGKLRSGGKSDGLMSVVHVPSGTTLDRSKGLFGLYRVFTTNRRYGGGAWDWESTARLRDDGSVEVFWPSTTDRPFDLRAVYRWSERSALDLEINVKALDVLPKFEVFLASYCNEPFTNVTVYAKEQNSAARFLPAREQFGVWQCFPRDASAAEIVQDGRWNIPPSPVKWVIRPNYSAPLAVRQNPATGLGALVMASPNDCFAVLTPHELEKHNSLYLSLFGRDLKRGESAAAHARLVIAEKISDAEAEAAYARFSSSLKK